LKIKSCELGEKSEYQIIVEVTPEEFESAVGKAFIKARKSVFVPGFRKGKASRKIIEGMYGATVFHPDALDIILPEVVEFVDKEQNDIKTVGDPQVTDIDIKEDKSGVVVTISHAAYPEVKLGEYKGLSAVKLSADIPESLVDAEVETARNRNARIEKAERPAVDGDITIIDFDGYVDGKQFEGGKAEGFELELGSKAFIPGFEDQLIGMNPGEERDIELVFPEEYTPELSGKPVVFKVKLVEIKEKLLPELDDEFAKDVSEFDTLKEYKADIKQRLTDAKQSESDAQFENALLDKLIENIEVEVPEVMIENQIDISVDNFVRQMQSYGMDPAQYLKMTGMTPEEFRANMREGCEKTVKITLALDKIAEVESIEVSDEEVENEYKEASERFEMEIDKIKESVPKDRIVKDIKSRHALKLVTDTAKAEDAPAFEPEEEPKAEKKAKTAVKPKPAAKTKGEAKSDEPKAKEKASDKEEKTAKTDEKPTAKKAVVKKASEKASEDAPKKATVKKAEPKAESKPKAKVTAKKAEEKK